MDDFGSGFGSLFYLKHLHFDGVKIDGEFVKHPPESTTDLVTLDAIVSVAHGLHKEVTAEFVQNDQTLARCATSASTMRRATTSPSPPRCPSSQRCPRPLVRQVV